MERPLKKTGRFYSNLPCLVCGHVAGGLSVLCLGLPPDMSAGQARQCPGNICQGEDLCRHGRDSFLCRQIHHSWASLSSIEDRIVEQLQLNSTAFTLVALSNENDFIGTAGIKRFELPSHHDKEYWLSEVFIPKSHRGQGIGSALINDCIKRSADLSIQALYLYTPDQQKLYQRFGWHNIEQTVVNNEAVSIMVRHARDNS